MDEERYNLSQIKELVEQGQYRVDPSAVADALLARLRELAESREQGRLRGAAPAPTAGWRLQIRCS
jgi:primosomal protein N''